jgi:hypothetical protein
MGLAEEDEDLRATLEEWFREHRFNPQMEIEARLRDVTEKQFDAVLSKLKKNDKWTRTESVNTKDIVYMSGIRETQSDRGSTFLRKTTSDFRDVTDEASGKTTVRISLQKEEPMASVSDSDQPQCVRYKHRNSFEHKKMFLFELTRVWQGRTSELAKTANPQFEIELEFKGQLEEAVQEPSSLASSFLLKIEDLLSHCKAADSGGASARVGTAQSAIVRLQPDSVVRLVGGEGRAEYSATDVLPVEIATQLDWILVSDADPTNVRIISLPGELTLPGDARSRIVPCSFWSAHVSSAAIRGR